MAKIRKCLPTDLERVKEIKELSFPDPWSKEALIKTYHRYPDSFIVAEENEEITGYAIGKIQNCSARIISLAVDPKWQKQGIGTALVKFLIKHLKEKGVEKISLNVRIWNKEALLFYKNLGFEIIKIIKRYYSNGDDAYLMKKDLGG